MLYLKLSLRNARRSAADYLLYLVTMTVLLAVIEVADCIAICTEAAGFRAASLPLLVTVIQIILAYYMEDFMLKQRAKEFANYLLLGMDKDKLTGLFLLEVLLIGFCCYLVGTTIGFAVYGCWYFQQPIQGMQEGGVLYGKSMLDTLLYFALIQAVGAFCLKRRLTRLQIRELMYEKERGQNPQSVKGCKRWGVVFLLSFACFMGLVCGIAFLPGNLQVYFVSVVALPLLLSVFAFYQWVFGGLYALRRLQPAAICQKDRIYCLANVTSDCRTAAVINTVFCICFLFSVSSFVVGRLMLQPAFPLFDPTVRRWMGTSQISICIVFLVIYFSVLSLQQMIELRKNAKDIRIMRCMGKSGGQIRKLVRKQTAVRLTTPVLMTLPILLCCAPLINGKLNFSLPSALRHILLWYIGQCGACFLVFYLCYFGMVCAVGRRYMGGAD